MNRFQGFPFRWYSASSRSTRPGAASIGGRTVPEQLPGETRQNTPPDTAGRTLRDKGPARPPSVRRTPRSAWGCKPFLFPPRLEFVFLNIWRTVSKEMLPANSISTTLSASRWSVQFTCPSGGLLHAMATRSASCLPSNLRSRSGRGLALTAASSPSSTKRLGYSGNGRSVDQKHTGYLTVPKSYICFEQRQCPLDGVGLTACLRWETSLRRDAFGFSQLDFILDGSHDGILPHRKMIPKYALEPSGDYGKSIWERY